MHILRQVPRLSQRCMLDGWMIPGVRQRLDLDYAVAGLSDVGRGYQRNVINSLDSGAADLEVYVHSTKHESGFMFRTNEPVFPRVTSPVLWTVITAAAGSGPPSGYGASLAGGR